MLKRLLFVGALVGSLFGSAAQATTTLTLAPSNGAIAGKPNSPIGWGFNLLNDENFLVVTSASFETSATWGSFTDFISAANFFVVGPAPSGSTVWAQKFDAAAQTGIGSFVIDAGTPRGSVASGLVVLSYDLFSRSPLDEHFDPDTDTLSNGNLLSAAATVTVAVPEPGTWALLLAGIGVVGWRQRQHPGPAWVAEVPGRRPVRQLLRASRTGALLPSTSNSVRPDMYVTHRAQATHPTPANPLHAMLVVAHLASRSRPLTPLLLTAALLATGGNANAYVFTDLGTLDPSNPSAYSEAEGINDAGQVVGYGSSAPGGPYATAIVWTGRTPVALSAVVGGAFSYGHGINKGGQVAGYSGPAGHGTRWDGGAPTDLNSLRGDSSAFAINDAGKAAGYSEVGVGSRAVYWNNGSSTPIALGTLGGYNARAQAINASGQMAGSAQTADGLFHATLWNGRTPTDLGTLTSPDGGKKGSISVAFGMNDAGQVVGWSYIDGFSNAHAALWNGTTAIDLGVGTAYDINNAGQVVGKNGSGAVLWNGTVATNLNSFLDAAVVRAGWSLRDAKAINDRGWITGTAVNSLTGERHAYILSVPEPETCALMLAGLAVLGFAARYRERNTAVGSRR